MSVRWVYIDIKNDLNNWEHFLLWFQSAETGFLKKLRDKLNSYPLSRCVNQSQCIDQVKSGSHVYIDVSKLYTDFIHPSAVDSIWIR